VWVDDVRFQSGAAQLWRRDFENGIAIANASGSARSVDLGQTFRKINGTQDRSINDGSAVNRATLPAYDGIILLRESSASAASYPYTMFIPAVRVDESQTGGQCPS